MKNKTEMTQTGQSSSTRGEEDTVTRCRRNRNNQTRTGHVKSCVNSQSSLKILSTGYLILI